MSDPQFQILLIGDTKRPEFREACRALDEVARVTPCADVQQAADMLREGSLAPQGILLAQAWPGQFSTPAIDRLRNLAPLARMFAILGSWCEGETRSGNPLPGVTRLYWHQAGVRIRREFRDCGQSEDSTWRLPPTATDEERLLASARLPLPEGNGLVVLWTRRAEIEGLLSDTCRRAGYASVWMHPCRPVRIRGARAAIYDCAFLDAAGLAELKDLTAQISPARVLALLDAPRIQDVRIAGALGVEVLAKPFRIDELLWLLSTFRNAESRGAMERAG
jgi:hypothetical protein